MQFWSIHNEKYQNWIFFLSFGIQGDTVTHTHNRIPYIATSRIRTHDPKTPQAHQCIPYTTQDSRTVAARFLVLFHAKKSQRIIVMQINLYSHLGGQIFPLTIDRDIFFSFTYSKYGQYPATHAKAED